MPINPFSAYSHLLGAIVFAALSLSLIRRAHSNGMHPVGTAVFIFAVIFQLVASTLYHTIPHDTPAGEIARRLDHAAIFVLIAGTFTPIHLLLFCGVLRWGILTLIWTCAVIGIALKLAFFSSIPDWLHTSAYVVMGWLGAIGAVVAIRERGWRFMWPVGLAALAFTGGAVLELAQWPVIAPGFASHEIFHICVLIGIGAFWWFVWGLVGPAGAAAAHVIPAFESAESDDTPDVIVVTSKAAETAA